MWNLQFTLKLNGVWCRAIAALVMCVASSAAGAATTPQSQTKPPAESPTRTPWRITFQISGGIIGMDRLLELDGSGALKIVDRRRDVQITDRLPDAELNQISALVTALKANGATRDAACRDCLQYDLNVHDPERSLAFRLSDATITGAPAEQLVRVLTSLVNRELTKPRTP